MKDTQPLQDEPLTCERKLELIQNIRQAFLQLLSENQGEQEKFDELDIERVKKFNWIVERHLMNTNWNTDLAFKNLVENLQWRKQFGVNQLKEEDFPSEFYKSGSFFDYETDKFGHSIIYIRGKLHKKISDWTPLFKKFFVFIVNKVENEVYYNLDDKSDKQGKENKAAEHNLINDKESADEKSGDFKQSKNTQLDEIASKNDDHNRLHGFSVFWDCNGAGLSNVDMDILSFMVKTITTNFPLGLAHVYIYELPWILQQVLGLVRSWIPEYYLNSIVLVKKDDLHDYFDVNHLPAYLEGKCKRKYSTAPKSCLNAEQIGQLNGISTSNIKKLQKHVKAACKEKD